FQAEDGIRDDLVTGVQTCALPISLDWLFARGPHAARAGEPLPPVVLLDLKLPKLDGFDVLREIRADARTRLLPVVLLTSSREDRSEERRVGQGGAYGRAAAAVSHA